jgi:hypothetical protein
MGHNGKDSVGNAKNDCRNSRGGVELIALDELGYIPFLRVDFVAKLTHTMIITSHRFGGGKNIDR